MKTKIPVLDKGYVQCLGTFGKDRTVVESARVSYGKGTKKVSNDEGLIRFLMRHRHTTPFEMCEARFRIKLPLFVARQWHRHRTASINEISARYSIVEEEFYVPAPKDIHPQGTTNRQVGDRETRIPPARARKVQEQIQTSSQQASETYRAFLENQEPIARETARIVMPLNTYTTMIWKTNAHNLMHFLTLRLGDNAQIEIQRYAQALLKIFQEWMPLTHQAFQDYRLQARTLSRMQVEALRKELARHPQTRSRILDSMPTARERAEFQEILEIPQKPTQKTTQKPKRVTKS